MVGSIPSWKLNRWQRFCSLCSSSAPETVIRRVKNVVLLQRVGGLGLHFSESVIYFVYRRFSETRAIYVLSYSSCSVIERLLGAEGLYGVHTRTEM